MFVPIIIVFCILWILFVSSHFSSSGEDGRYEGYKYNEEGPKGGGFEFRGYTRARGRHPRIAIVTNAVAFPYEDKTIALWSMFKEYFANKDCYARTHGYDLIVDSRYVPYLLVRYHVW